MGAHGGLANFRKGGDLFIESLKKINYLKDEYEIIILGQKENYIDSINGFKFNFRKFEKKISRQILYQSVTNLVIIPSRAESIPQFAVESIICQNPVVSFKIGGMNEIIEHKKNGYLAKPFNINDFSKGIDYCLTKIDKKNLKKFSNKLKVQFGQENINKSYNNLFNSILSKS
jgi:glycosyltransferase involved in cell wall biosynthesis